MKNESRQRELLKAIQDWQEANEGVAPTFAELATELEVSPAAIYVGVHQLREDGRILRKDGKWRSLEITDPDFAVMTREELRAEIKRVTAERDELAERLAKVLKRRKK